MVGVVEENTSMIDEQGREASGKDCQELFINGHYYSQIVTWTLKCLRWVHSHPAPLHVSTEWKCVFKACGIWDQGISLGQGLRGIEKTVLWR